MGLKTNRRTVFTAGHREAADRSRTHGARHGVCTQCYRVHAVRYGAVTVTIAVATDGNRADLACLCIAADGDTCIVGCEGTKLSTIAIAADGDAAASQRSCCLTDRHGREAVRNGEMTERSGPFCGCYCAPAEGGSSGTHGKRLSADSSRGRAHGGGIVDVVIGVGILVDIGDAVHIRIDEIAVAPNG